MEYTKENIINSVLVIADMYDKKENYEKMIESSSFSTPMLFISIVYDMFLYKFDKWLCTNDQYAAYRNIFDYATELDEKGFVKFKEEEK